MSTIDVRRSHALSKDEARKRAEELAQSMQQKLGIEWSWQGDLIVFDAPRGPAKGTKGSVEVTDSEVRVRIEIPFLLRMMKGTIESKVTDKLNQFL